MVETKIIKVLLIEDESTLSSMYQAKFKRDGFIVIAACDGEDGLIKAKESIFDIIMVDIIMPKLDGFSVLKELRTWPQYRMTPIVLLTNLGQEEDIKKGQVLGATDYLVKASFTPGQVAEKIKELLK